MTASFRPCSCAEAELLRDVLAGRVPASTESPAWSVLLWFIDAAVLRRLRQVSHDLSAAADWRKLADHPSHNELVRRRALPGRLAEQWRERHGGEHPGGPVTWTTEEVAA